MNKQNIFDATKMSIETMFLSKGINEQTVPNLVDLINRTINSMPEYSFIDKDEMSIQIQMDLNISYDKHGTLIEKDWKPWLFPESDKPTDENREDIEWKFFNDYIKILMPKYGSKGTDKVFDESLDVLRYLEDPVSDGLWYRKGVVVGEVQSGKTSNYNAVICRAADAGYRIFIILAGAHKDLRAQTQTRLDEDFFGKDTGDPRRRKIGVGTISGHPNVITLTNSTDAGDFSIRGPDIANISKLDGLPPLYVVLKKNVSILKNIFIWLKQFTNNGLIDIPMLFIDDECDYASVDTNKRVDDDEYNPTKINLNIRKIISLFSKKCYLGYTATPFANILIHRDSDHPEWGPDLFPDNFIINIKAPSNYNGPLDYFGIKQIKDEDPENVAELPLTRIVKDQGVLQTENITQIPDSLKEALRIFILSCAARSARGQGFKHNSMLIHTARFTAEQSIVNSFVKSEVENIKNEIQYGDCESLKHLWASDFVPTSKLILESDDFEKSVKIGIRIDEWDTIRNNLNEVIQKLLIKEVNASAGDLLEYAQYQDNGINYIAIGGDKLSRGLTLEGLTVSYYLRSAAYYDTLMQMGRWFGYRTGYLDLCRLYTTQTLIINYRKIAISTRKLMIDFNDMVRRGMEPKDFGMKVQNDPGRLTVTNLGKRRHGEFIDISYKGKRPQTMAIYADEKNAMINYNAVNTLLKESKNEIKKNFGYVYDDINSEKVKNFLREIKIHLTNNIFNPQLMSEYIEKLNNENNLHSWIVCLVSKKKPKLYSKLSYFPKNRNPGLTWRQETSTFNREKESVHFAHGFADGQNHIDPLQSDYSGNGIIVIYNLHGKDKDNGDNWGNTEIPCIGIVFQFPFMGPNVHARYLMDHLAVKNRRQQEIWEW